MKLSVTNDTLRRRLGDPAALDAIAAAGFDGVDYSFFGADACPELLEDPIGYARALKHQMDGLGLCCCQTHAPYDFDFCSEMRPEDPVFRKILQSIESSSILGAPYVVVHPVLSPVYVDMPAYNVRFFETLAPYCREFGIKIAIENIFDRAPYGGCMSRFSTTEQMARLLDRLEPECFCMCLDTGHATITGTPPEDFIRKLGKRYVRVLHLQDTCLKDDDHMLPLLGDQNWEPVWDALAEIDFEGALSLEVPGYFGKLEGPLVVPGLELAAGVVRLFRQKIQDRKDLLQAQKKSLQKSAVF